MGVSDTFTGPRPLDMPFKGCDNVVSSLGLVALCSE